MTRFFVAAALVLLDTQTPTTIVGVWESTTTSRGGIGSVMEFRADGTMTSTTAMIGDFRYRLEGDRLVLEFPAAADVPGSPKSIPISIQFEDNAFVQTAPNGSTTRRERMGDPPAGHPPIVGVWRYRHNTGATAFERYLPDGRALLRIPLLSRTGRYALTGNELTVTLPKEGEKKGRVEIEGEELRIIHDEGTTAFRRVSDPWYTLEARPQK